MKKLGHIVFPLIQFLQFCFFALDILKCMFQKVHIFIRVIISLTFAKILENSLMSNSSYTETEAFEDRAGRYWSPYYLPVGKV